MLTRVTIGAFHVRGRFGAGKRHVTRIIVSWVAVSRIIAADCIEIPVVDVVGQKITVGTFPGCIVECRVYLFFEGLSGALTRVTIGAFHVREMTVCVVEVLIGLIEHSQHLVQRCIVVVCMVMTHTVRTENDCIAFKETWVSKKSMATLTVSQVLERIRFDHETKRGSVLDVIMLVTKCSSGHASQVFQRLCKHHPEVTAEDLGRRLSTQQLCEIGRKAAAAYREIHGKNPPQHDGFANGHVVKINTYFEKDRTLLIDAIHSIQSCV